MITYIIFSFDMPYLHTTLSFLIVKNLEKSKILISEKDNSNNPLFWVAGIASKVSVDGFKSVEVFIFSKATSTFTWNNNDILAIYNMAMVIHFTFQIELDSEWASEKFS